MHVLIAATGLRSDTTMWRIHDRNHCDARSTEAQGDHPRRLDLLIDGEWVKAQSEQTFQTRNPATGELLADCAQGDEVDIDIAVRAARRAFESGPWSQADGHRAGPADLEAR